MSEPLLLTKLFIPVPGKYLVGRAPLVEKLNRCLDPECRLTLISAPAGFGKTTLISNWAAEARKASPGQRTAWLSIDEKDNDPVIFWSYVIAALQTQQKGVGQQALDMLAVQGADLDWKLASLINDLAQDSHPWVMVLDDYHLIRNPIIHQSLTFFSEHAPAHIHLMIASRTDPPLPLSLLRGRGQLLEIRLQDLRFSDEDAEVYLNASHSLNLASPSVLALNQKTEGWIAGLQMAAISLRDAAALPDPEKAANFVASFSGSNRFILDYLIEEVLNRQPEPIQHFLIWTSILDQLCAPLCAALLQGSEAAAQLSAQSALEYLENSNLFILPLDQERYWYRYHQLFADLLRKRLAQSAPEAVQALHRRAVRWYEQNGLISSAIQHAFKLQDFHKAAALVAQVTEAMWGRGEHATLLSWMDALPDEEKQAYPSLLVFQVSMLISAGKLREAEACIPILEGYIQASLEQPNERSRGGEADPERAALIGKVSALRTYIASFYGDQPALLAHAQTALQHLTQDEDAGQRCGVSLVLGNAYLTQGALAAAERTFVDAVAAGKKAQKPPMLLTGLSNLAVVLWMQGNLSRTAQVCQEGLQMIAQYGLDRAPMTVDIWLTWGMILCERGEQAEAEPYIRQGLELAQEQQFIWQVAWGYLALARLRLAQGDLAGAETAARAGEQWAAAHEVPAHISCEAAGLLAELWLRQGKTSRAARYLALRELQVDEDIQFPHQVEFLAWARLKWIQGDTEGAAGLLERLAQWAEKHRQTSVLLAVYILQAAVSQSRGNPKKGLAFLRQALELAEPEGYAQTFINEGQPIAVLLREALKHKITPEYAGRLLGLLPNLPGARPASSPEADPDRGQQVLPETMPLIEPLSRREMETLRLMAEGCSNKEIAQKLFISLRTVKYYSTGIYNKLGVDSRMQAVIRARELELLNPWYDAAF